jgi:hypothetical protein
MAEWKVDTSQPAIVEHTAELPGGIARVIIAVVSGTSDFAVRVFVTRPGAADEEVAVETPVHPDPVTATALGKSVAEKALS